MIERDQLSRLQTLSILTGAALTLSLSMGMRQSFGLFQPHMVRDIGITATPYLSQSNGGVYGFGTAAEMPARAVLSGPSGVGMTSR